MWLVCRSIEEIAYPNRSWSTQTKITSIHRLSVYCLSYRSSFIAETGMADSVKEKAKSSESTHIKSKNLAESQSSSRMASSQSSNRRSSSLSRRKNKQEKIQKKETKKQNPEKTTKTNIKILIKMLYIFIYFVGLSVVGSGGGRGAVADDEDMQDCESYSARAEDSYW